MFEAKELETAQYAEGRIAWKAPDADAAQLERLRVPKNTGAPQWKPESAELLIGEIVTCLYVGLCRLKRGEKFSAFRFGRGHALNLLLELICMEEAAIAEKIAALPSLKNTHGNY